MNVLVYRKSLDMYIFQDFRNTTGFIQKNLLSDFNDRITEIAEKEYFKKSYNSGFGQTIEKTTNL